MRLREGLGGMGWGGAGGRAGWCVRVVEGKRGGMQG